MSKASRPRATPSRIATEIFINEYRGQYPLISSFCPTVVRLLQVKYPELVDQLLPVLAPREISARAAKIRLSKETGLPLDKIGAVYITPCPAKIVSILEHPGMQRSHLDAAVSICDLFQTLAAAVSRVQETEYKIDSGRVGLGSGLGLFGQIPAIAAGRKHAVCGRTAQRDAHPG